MGLGQAVGRTGSWHGRQARAGEAELWSIKAASRPIHKPLLPPYAVFLRWFVPSFHFISRLPGCLPHRSGTTGFLFQAGIVASLGVDVTSFDVRCTSLLSGLAPQPQPALSTSTSAVPFAHAALMAYNNAATNVTIAMWYTPAESRGVGVSPNRHSSQYTQRINISSGARSYRNVVSAISHRFDHHHGRTSFLSSNSGNLPLIFSPHLPRSPGVRNSQYSVP